MKWTVHIDTSDMHTTRVAITSGEIRHEESRQSRVLKSQTVLPMIEELLSSHNLTYDDVGAVRVVTGPGSFTGLRVGCAVANALGLLLNVPVNGKTVPAVPEYA